MPLIAVDQRFIENLQNVAFDLIEAKAAHMRQDATDKGLALRFRDHPVEEIAFRGAEDAGCLERRAGQYVPGIIVAQAEHRQRDGLGNDHKESVLEEKRVAFDLAPIDQFQELGP
jgi:hypothetical protein